MSEQDDAGVPFASDSAGEQQLWKELGHLPHLAPSPRLRQRFYDELDEASRSTRVGRRRDWLRRSRVSGLLAAMGCLVVGLVVGVLLSHSSRAERTELAELQKQVATLHRDLILDRLESDSASKRLLGVIDAVGVAGNDAEVTGALLARAVDDRVYSVRLAAIEAIGPRLSTPAVSDKLMALLEKTGSPLVQLALVDLVLRHGSAPQLERLLQLSELGTLHPDVAQHVKSSVWRNRA